MNVLIIAAVPIVMNCNKHGCWSPNGSVPNLPQRPPVVRVIPPPKQDPVPVVVEEPVVTNSDECPTRHSQPHLCRV